MARPADFKAAVQYIESFRDSLPTAQALVVSELGGPFEVKEVRLGEMRADEVVVKMIATGICHTDIASATVGSLILLSLFYIFSTHQTLHSTCYLMKQNNPISPTGQTSACTACRSWT